GCIKNLDDPVNGVPESQTLPAELGVWYIKQINYDRKETSADIQFTPKRECESKNIGFIQIVRRLTTEKTAVGEPQTDPDLVPPYRLGRMTDSGWRVDRAEDMISGFYGQLNNGQIALNVAIGDSTTGETAQARDRPGNYIANEIVQFETYA